MNQFYGNVARAIISNRCLLSERRNDRRNASANSRERRSAGAGGGGRGRAALLISLRTMPPPEDELINVRGIAALRSACDCVTRALDARDNNFRGIRAARFRGNYEMTRLHALPVRAEPLPYPTLRKIRFFKPAAKEFFLTITLR